jgi:diguanylate cyclase (GGDEF)-like protein
MAGGLDTGAMLDAVADAARRALDADRASCYVHSQDQSSVEAVHTTEQDPERRRFLLATVGRPRGAVPIWQLIQGPPGSMIAVPDVSRADRIPKGLRRRLGAGAFLGVRLEHASVEATGHDATTALGTLFVSWARPREISAQDGRIAGVLANLASLAIANARLQAATLAALEAAERRAALDPLTGLANHRTFHERLAAEATRADRHHRALSLVLFDLDRFKHVNDTFGHQAGDQVLAEAARILVREAREGDLVARVGGEEFAWLMPEADGLDAWQAAERARAALAAAAFPAVGRMTVSAGVCELAQAGNAANLYRLADGALYWAKHHGRDVVFHYSPEVVRALSAEEQAIRLRRQQSLQSIRMLARAVDAKDPTTRRHSERVADLAVALATALGWSTGKAVRLHEAGLVHDVGKLAVADAVLRKDGPLTDAEHEALRAHAALGAEIVSDVLDSDQVAWVRGHHERWDGAGYPDGLAGEELPEGAAILALADAWDAMTSPRSYRPPLAPAEALAECARGEGRQFAPRVVAAARGLWEAGALPVPGGSDTGRTGAPADGAPADAQG